MKSEKQLILKSSRHSTVEKNQESSLVITEVALEDSGWYYCEVNVLQKEPELGNGTELVVLGWLVNSKPPRRPQCFQVMNNHSGEVYLFSVFFLPQKQSLDTGITFTCGVQDHPAMTTALTASFTWDTSPNELIVNLNILKMCFLSAVTVVLLLEAVKHFCIQRK
ncbi:hypothetical protein PAMP_002783 [Pampus punctatissimus]